MPTRPTGRDHVDEGGAAADGHLAFPRRRLRRDEDPLLARQHRPGPPGVVRHHRQQQPAPAPTPLIRSPLVPPPSKAVHPFTNSRRRSLPACSSSHSILPPSPHKPRAAGRQDSPPHAVLGAPPRRPERGPTPARDRDEGRSPGHARPEGAQEGEGAAEVGGAVAPLVEAVELPHLVPRRSAKLLSAFCSVLNRIQSGPTPAPCPPAEDAPPPPAPFPATQPVRFCTCVR